MKIGALNTVGGKDIPFATLVLNLQVELLFIYGDPCGIINHYDNTVYLETAHNKFWEQIQQMLWDREQNGKALYRCVNFTPDQEREMWLRMGWIVQAIAQQIDIVMGVDKNASTTIIEKRNGLFKAPKSLRHAPVVIHDYDEPVESGMDADELRDDDAYGCDDGGNFYRIFRS